MSLTANVVELCALLQCLGFSVKSLDTIDPNASQEGGVRTVVINCQSSGLHVVLESASLSCSCPATNQQQNSGVWQVSATAGGKQLDKEFGCSLLGSLPKSHRDRLTKELHDIIRCIKQHSDTEERIKDKETPVNKSASMLDLKTPEKIHHQIKLDTPTRYRSLDTLTKATKDDVEQVLPVPGVLQRPHLNSEPSDDDKGDQSKQTMCRRQSTYTLSSTPGSIRRRNKTSSPIKPQHLNLFENLMAAEKTAEDLRKQLSCIVRDFMEDGKNDSSMTSLVLDVSKISVLKAPETSKSQFASSPNLSALTLQDDFMKNRLKRFESASTSDLASNKSAPVKEGKMSRLRRISPNFFKTKKEGPTIKIDKAKVEAKSNKLNSLLRPKIITPVRTPRQNTESSPNLSASSKKKFSHVKSTIPRPSKKE
ncbi:hypothetical protein O3G_MSEX005109 [Manduca sexta]|uniref:Uncharacterized protein n=1 Tax=Manduca sexta TaxID=7130 RepID=A0A921YXY8_MANSE|nr:hypothetical protein O3G_MSEX005109 [Manduca sexta]